MWMASVRLDDPLHLGSTRGSWYLLGGPLRRARLMQI